MTVTQGPGHRLGRLLNQMELEEAIVELGDSLEDLTEDYDSKAATAAEAEVDYKLAYFRTILGVKANGLWIPNDDGEQVYQAKVTDKLADAYATVEAADLFRAYKISDKAADACRASMFARRDRLESLRTLSANVRSQTT